MYILEHIIIGFEKYFLEYNFNFAFLEYNFNFAL